MISTRSTFLTVALLALIWTMAFLVRAYERRANRNRAQPLIDLIESASRRTPAAPLQTNKSVATVDAALTPQVQMMLNRGITPNAWGESDTSYNGQREFTPLMLAAMLRLPKTAQALIRADADLDTTDHDGRTALIWAVKCGNSEVVQILLAAGADANHVDRRGLTAIDYAYYYHQGWDSQEALLRPLKRVQAKAGPYALRKISPFQRFTLERARHGQLSSETTGDGITFHSKTTITFPETPQPILTREKCNQLQSGMTYSDVASVIGKDEVGGQMETDYQGSFTFVQGRRRITLRFREARVSAKYCTAL